MPNRDMLRTPLGEAQGRAKSRYGEAEEMSNATVRLKANRIPRDTKVSLKLG